MSATSGQADTMFSWIPIYTEMARKLLSYRNRQTDLITMLKELEKRGLPVISMVDYDKEDKELQLAQIDPFTFFACFNRGITNDNRRSILTYLKESLELESEVPTDFEGIPVVDNRQARFFSYIHTRDPDDIPSLWALAETVVKELPEKLDTKLFE